MKRLLAHIDDMEHGDLVLRALAYLLVAAQLALLCLLLPGCGGPASVVVPARETAENWQSDTLATPDVPEVEPAGAGRVALPARVERHAAIPAPAPFEVSEIELSADTLTVRSPTVTRHFRTAAVGETLRVRREDPPGALDADVAADTPAGTPHVVGRVDGRPQPDTISTEAPEKAEKRRGALEKLLGLPGWALALLIVVLAAVAIFFFRIFR